MRLTKEEIHDYLYQSYEAKIIYLSSNYFGERLTVLCEDDIEYYTKYDFLDCYKTDVAHLLDYPKNKRYQYTNKELLPFYLSDWNIRIEKGLYLLKLIAHPMYIEIWCKDMEISKVKKAECAMLDIKND